jgi:uncharacterized protein (DUF433 family)
MPDGGWRVGTSRVSLDSVIHGYLDGLSPEAIVDEFPSLTAEQVYGAVAWYLGHRDEVDRHLEQQAARWQQLRDASEARNGPLLNRIRSQRGLTKRLGQP